MAILGFFLLGIFAFVRAAIEHGGWTPWWQFVALLDLSRDLGIAAIVAAAVSLGIERISRAELKNEIAEERRDFHIQIANIRDGIGDDRLEFASYVAIQIKNIEESVLNGVFSKKYPKSYIDSIGDILQGGKWFKTNSNVVIDLVPLSDECVDSLGERQIDYFSTSSYHITNVSGADQDFEQNLFLDREWDGNCTPEILIWKIGDKELTPEDISASAREVHNSPFTQWFRFPHPVRLKAGEGIDVYFRTRRRKYARDATTYCSLSPSDGIRFTVNHPFKMRVYVDAKTPATPTEYPQGSDGQHVTIEIFKPLLPYFTVELGWRPESTNAALSSVSTTGAGLQG